MTKLILKTLIFSILLLGLSNCAVFTKTKSGYTNYTKENKLDSTQLAYKRHLQKFTKAVQDKQDISNLIADSLYCFWEIGGDTLFIQSNSNKISKKEFLKNYYPKVFNNQYVNYICDDKNIFSIHDKTSEMIERKSREGFTVIFGPRKCVWEPCGYEYFEFIKTKNSYKLYKLWLL